MFFLYSDGDIMFMYLYLYSHSYSYEFAYEFSYEFSDEFSYELSYILGFPRTYIYIVLGEYLTARQHLILDYPMALRNEFLLSSSLQPLKKRLSSSHLASNHQSLKKKNFPHLISPPTIKV